MSAVIGETSTVWNKETKNTDVSITLYNYTSRSRAYTILATWPEKADAKMIDNETGGRKEAMGVWAWKLQTLDPGERIVISYSLSGLEKGDWVETDIFYRGSQEVIGAMKMDEKYLEEIRNQEQIMKEINQENNNQEVQTETIDDVESDPDAPEIDLDEIIASLGEPKVAPPSGQSTLFGGDL